MVPFQHNNLLKGLLRPGQIAAVHMGQAFGKVHILTFLFIFDSFDQHLKRQIGLLGLQAQEPEAVIGPGQRAAPTGILEIGL